MATNHGSIEFLKFPNPQYPGDNTKLIKKWLRDSWARRKILALQQTIAAIVVPTKTSQLTNDSGFITSSDLPSVPSPSTANPKMDGTASAGSSATWSRGDHVHPHDTSKADKATTLSGYGITNAYTKTEVDGLIPTVPTDVSAFTNDAGYITVSSVPDASSTTPAMDGTGTAGSSADYARADHVHPSDTSKQDALTTAQLAAVNSGITAEKVADYDELKAYTLTYTTNSYVTNTAFNRIKVQKVSPHLAILSFQLLLSAAMDVTDFVTIGQISGISLEITSYAVVAGQLGNGAAITVYVTTSGAIRLYSHTGASGEWYRAMIPMIIK